MRKTKLVITVGPALADEGLLREALSIADAVRINASHSRIEERGALLERIRDLAGATGRRIPVFLDLQGPKWRIGILAEPLALAVGAALAFAPEGDGVPAVPLPHPELFAGARPGQRWLLDDGNLEVEVTRVEAGQVLTRVVTGGLLKSRKGIHPIGLDVAFDPLTPQDLEDVRWGVEHGVDLFAQSFVRHASDIRALEARIREHGGSQPVIAKIEHPKALDNLEGILEAAWGIMVARGDLGVELGVHRVPSIQKRIIRKCRRALKPVITATQMLESMIENPQPTRAEASDVANAIWDGTDAVMLSAESAAGRYPVEAIRWLARIAEDADLHERARGGRTVDPLPESLNRRTDVAVAFAACRTAAEIDARWIVVFTEGGGSARMVSRLAGGADILGATTDEGNARRMGLLRGVQSLLIPRVESTDEMVGAVEALLQSRHSLEPGDRVVMTLGLPLWRSGTTNTVKVVEY
jgi:pyruvate kinase